MAMPRVALFVLLVGAAAGLITFQILVPGPSEDLFWSDVFDAGHAPLYGLVALAILRLLQVRRYGTGGSRIRSYLLALVLTVTAGLMAEFIQSLGIGDGDIADRVG